VHPFGDLSAYLDGALSSEARASVQAHLDTCALCRTRLAELRGTARLIAALPMPVPSRSLVPRVSVPFWLAPLRTFSTFASGAAIFLFLASAVIAYFPRAQSAGAAAAPAVSQPAASGAGDRALQPPSPQNFQVSAPSPAPVASTSDRTGAGQSATPDDSAKEIGRRQDSPGPASNSVADQSTRARTAPVPEPAPFAILLSPWLWLVLAMAFATISIVVGRRLRST
jgi:hypothetical protein